MEPRDLPVVAALGALSVTVALAFGRVLDGDRWVVPLVAAALAPHVAGAIVRALRRGPWVGLAASAALLVIGILVATPGGPDPGAVVDRVRASWEVVRTHSVPLPPRPGIVLLAALVVWSVAALADHLAFRREATLGAVAPGVVVMIWCTALGTHGGRWLTVAAFGFAATVFLALQHQRLLDRHRTRLGTAGRFVDAPRMLVLGVVAGLVAVGIGVAGAITLPDADRPMVDTGGLESGGGGARSYRTAIPPLLDVGSKLRQQDEQTLFTVAANDSDYWRITALDEYTNTAGGQWSLTAEGDDAVGEGLDESVPSGALVQRYRIGPLSERWMPAAYRAVRVSLPDTLVVRASTTLVTGRASVEGLDYSVASTPPPRTLDAATRRAATGEVPADLRRYTNLPPDLPPVVAETASTVAGKLADPIDQATALRDFFRDGSFTYDPGFTAGDDEAAVSAFLRDRRGFCVQFATAYALMARALGIPARVAVGFTPGAHDAATGTFTVSNHDAHAWPELWFAGLGWTHLFDPTPTSDLPGGSALPDEIPPLPPPAATDPGTAPPTTTPATVAAATSPGSSTPPATAAPNGGGVHIAADAPPTEGGGPVWPFVALALVVALVVGPLVAILVYKQRRRARRRHDPDPRHAIFGAWHEALDALMDHRVPRSPADTPIELAGRAPAIAGDRTGAPLQSLAGAYSAARYGDGVPADEMADAAWHEVDELQRALSSTRGLWARVRARLSVKTFGREREPV
jgi:hypothetical protein